MCPSTAPYARQSTPWRVLMQYLCLASTGRRCVAPDMLHPRGSAHPAVARTRMGWAAGGDPPVGDEAGVDYARGGVEITWRAWPTATPCTRALAGHPETLGRALTSSGCRALCFCGKTCLRNGDHPGHLQGVPLQDCPHVWTTRIVVRDVHAPRPRRLAVPAQPLGRWCAVCPGALRRRVLQHTMATPAIIRLSDAGKPRCCTE